MKIETVPIADLQLDPENARRHESANLAAITGSLRRFGQQKPIVIDAANVVRAGNGTLQAAMSLGWTDIEIVRAEDLEGRTASAFAIADNRTGELAEWDDLALAETLDALRNEDIDLTDIGFTEEDLDARIAAIGDAILPPDADGKEYDETAADDVEYCTCPDCGHEWPR